MVRSNDRTSDNAVSTAGLVAALNRQRCRCCCVIFTTMQSGGSSIRGHRPGSDRTNDKPYKPKPRAAYAVDDPALPRGVVDHRLAKLAVIAELRRNPAADFEFTTHIDPDPYLQRAATRLAVKTERSCPWCAASGLRHVNYIYGDDIGTRAGHAVSPKDLPAMAHEFGEFDVWVVEVCLSCGWNHVHLTYTLGDGRARP
ncbi:MAG: hypothetical protein RL745_629 [Actinomycetota bacterium]